MKARRPDISPTARYSIVYAGSESDDLRCRNSVLQLVAADSSRHMPTGPFHFIPSSADLSDRSPHITPERQADPREFTLQL